MLETVWRKRNLPTLLVGMQTGAATMEKSMEFSQKTKNRTIIRSSNPTPGHISRKEKNFNSKKHTYLNFHSSTVYKSQDTVRTQVPTNR